MFCPFRLWMARAASEFGISTKPKPRGLPVSRSLIRGPTHFAMLLEQLPHGRFVRRKRRLPT